MTVSPFQLGIFLGYDKILSFCELFLNTKMEIYHEQRNTTQFLHLMCTHSNVCKPASCPKSLLHHLIKAYLKQVALLQQGIQSLTY